MGIIRKTLFRYLPENVASFFRQNEIKKEYEQWHISEEKLKAEWEKDNSYVPVPHFVKENAIKQVAAKYQIKTLVETGTYLGFMLEALKDSFDNLISIELSEPLYQRAVKKFAPYPHIKIYNGDSAMTLPVAVRDIREKCLFWLDGHYSGGVTSKADIETPIMAELKTVFSHPVKDHLILIDDARLFIGTRDYPTIEGLKNYVSKLPGNYRLTVKYDIIFLHNADLPF
ncbi:MAG: hypothetical protein ACM3S2_07620 [Ignavibacteriales bacterium]